MEERRGRFNRGDFIEKYTMRRRGYIPPAKWNGLLQDIATGICSALITNVLGGTFSISSTGTKIAIESSNGGAAAAAALTHDYLMADASTTAYAGITVSYGTHNGWVPYINGLNLEPPLGEDPPATAPVLELGSAPGYVTVYFQFDFTADASGVIAITDGSINYANGANSTPASIFTPSVEAADGSGSGTLYQTLGQVVIGAPTMEGGKYTTNIQPSVVTAQQFNLCGKQINVGSM